MKKFLIIANWKMNPDSPGRAAILAKKIELSVGRSRGVGVVIAPPAPFLIPVGDVLKKAKLGAQNAFWADTGPYTGEISWHQLKHLGVSHVIVGHSERRIHLGETDALINLKIQALLREKLSPILCIGERERSDKDIPTSVGEQLKNGLKDVPKKQAKELIVAYEPVWAISTMPGARPDTPDNAFRASVYIRKILADLYDRKTAEQVTVIYGGSVNAGNISYFLHEGKMQGALVGGASLDPKEFEKIIQEASKISRRTP